MSDSDNALIARVVFSDDRVAFELLVRRHQSGLRNFLRRLSKGDIDRADDLAQETFAKVHRSLASFKGGSQFSTWLYRIAYNTFLNDQRNNLPGIESSFDETQHFGDCENINYSFQENAQHEMETERALRQLSSREQAVFDLHYQKGMTHSEIADTLALPVGTVKSDLTRGREKLKNFLSSGEKHE